MSEKPFGLSVSALINDGVGRLLLLKRSAKSRFWAGHWEAPGGKIDAGESFDQTLLRETEEETGLTISLDGVAGVSEFELPHTRVVQLFMTAHVVSGEIRLSDEHEEYAWLPIEEFTKKNLTVGLRKALNALSIAL
jgi:8-oxo-dGTP diphosphatase